jgi:hypothetical protein
MLKKLSIVLLLFIPLLSINAQEDLLDDLKQKSSKETSFELPAFKAMQIANLQSTKIADKGDLYLIVAHRFGPFSEGVDEFFGLDGANTKIQFAYSFWDGVQFSLSRDSFEKTYSGSTKIRLAKQSSVFPLNLVAYGSTDIASAKNLTGPTFKDRVSITAQLLASRRINKNLSFLIAPTFVRQNNLQKYKGTGDLNLNQFILGVGGRLKVSKRMSINVDYALNLNRHEKSIFSNPLTLGIDIETGGHVFQLVFTNARASNDSGFLTRTEGESLKNIAFGFNIVRVF